MALLLQKLKTHELPELPPPRHNPELLTPEQLQAYKKIGYKIEIMFLLVFVKSLEEEFKICTSIGSFTRPYRFCCDNCPKEKIKEMASMLARLSGGIVVNIHNVKRNCRQPKNLISINTLTKRKALFKAIFEQAFEPQRFNIKKTEQELRRKGVNPNDSVVMASIQRVASTFFNAIDKKEEALMSSRGTQKTQMESGSNLQQSQSAGDSDQEELDRFIAEIEEAADKEWAAEEAAEKEEFGKF